MSRSSFHQAFVKCTRGLAAMELALIFPALVFLALIAYESAGMYFSANRATMTFSSIANTVSSSPSDINCDFLQRISDQGFEMYRAGNWGRKLGPQGGSFSSTGGEDFQLEIIGLQVQDLSDPGVSSPSDLQARVLWSYSRASGSKTLGSPTLLTGQLLPVTQEYQYSETSLVMVRGHHKREPKLGFANFFNPVWRSRTFIYATRNPSGLNLAGPKSAICQGVS